MTPKVSIIIPNYNHAKFLQQRLDSVFNQTYQNFEVILLDDCSTDNSQSILLEYAKAPKVSHCVFNEVNSRSPFKQWKKGLDLSQGDYIWIAESDDYCELNFLECSVKRLLEGTDICYAQSYDVDEHGKNRKNRVLYTAQFQPNICEQDFNMEGNVFNINYLLVKNVIPNASAVVFKRDIVKDTFFDDVLLKMRMCGDWLFWIQLCAGNHIAFISEPLNYFRYHDSTSRIHYNLEKRKLRLQEEATLRSLVFKRLGILNKQQEVLLCKNWFNIHGFLEVFTKAFYRINMAQTSRKTIFLNFILQKFKSI
ncbi:glycosyltransferase [Mariniflexile litorale]|uniref:Glycosyltransferase n=1 Tax=Mariniflexile litorale TaxID=3045158 RepID=A0AAU7EB05_9FLAO|nr:glycosyltransferase [Mariniflexile sp. KMM 9835]MDQ8212222.1 glycosyltransferase [Mariniflexile sp. KMM 9835]